MRCLLLSIRIEERCKLPFLQVTPISVGRLRRHHRNHTCHTSAQNATTSTTPYFVYFLPEPTRPQSLRITASQTSAYTYVRFPSCRPYHQRNPPYHVVHPFLASDSSPAPPLPPRSSSHTHQRSIERMRHREQQARRGQTGRRGYLSWNDGVTYVTMHSVS